MYTTEDILKALSHVEDPDLKKDLVSLSMIKNITIKKSKIWFSVELTTPACPMKSLIEKKCIEAIHKHVDRNAEVNIKMTSKVIPMKNISIPGVKNIIVIASGKGGVGKSTIAANIAITLAKKGAKTGLIDADIHGPSIPIMFNLENAKPLSIEFDGKRKIKPIEKYGVKLLSIGFFTNAEQAIPWRGPMLSSAIKQLFNDAHWGDIDYLLIDMPPGTGDIHITVAQQFSISGTVIVTTPQKVALADSKKGLNMFQMDGIKIPILGIVENMSYFSQEDNKEKKHYIFGKDGGKKLAEEFNVPFLGEIPLMEDISIAGDKGIPITLQDDHIISKSFNVISETLTQEISINNMS